MFEDKRRSKGWQCECGSKTRTLSDTLTNDMYYESWCSKCGAQAPNHPSGRAEPRTSWSRGKKKDVEDAKEVMRQHHIAEGKAVVDEPFPKTNREFGNTAVYGPEKRTNNDIFARSKGSLDARSDVYIPNDDGDPF